MTRFLAFAAGVVAGGIAWGIWHAEELEALDRMNEICDRVRIDLDEYEQHEMAACGSIDHLKRPRGDCDEGMGTKGEWRM